MQIDFFGLLHSTPEDREAVDEKNVPHLTAGFNQKLLK